MTANKFKLFITGYIDTDKEQCQVFNRSHVVPTEVTGLKPDQTFGNTNHNTDTQVTEVEQHKY